MTTPSSTSSMASTTAKQIRTALGDDPEKPRFIQTVPRKGYRFLASVKGEGKDSGTQEAASPTRTEQGSPAGVASVALGGRRRLGVGIGLGTITSYDASPDGRFLMIRPAKAVDAGPTQLVVVLNWFDELARPSVQEAWTPHAGSRENLLPMNHRVCWIAVKGRKGFCLEASPSRWGECGP